MQVRNAAGQDLGAGIRVFLKTDVGELDPAGGTTDGNGLFESGLRASGGVTAGWRHTCALDAQGRAFCWGEGSLGRLGTGNEANAVTPQEVMGGQRLRFLDAGNSHTCGVRSSDGAVLCWGANQFGQVGDRAQAQSPVPVVMDAPRSLPSVTAGGAHSCGLSRVGSVHC